MSKTPDNFREMESGIHTDLEGRMSYDTYLDLDSILNAQHTVSSQHDEMLFIIIHQASELWLKLAGHEIEAARRNVRENDFRHAFKVIARVKLILNQLVHSWNILSTMTPVDYLTFRDLLGQASGFQSWSYRRLEFLLGNKNASLIQVHRHNPAVYDELNDLLHSRSLYDEVIRRLSESGFDIDPARLDRDFSLPYTPDESVQDAWLQIYRNADEYFELYELGEKLVDIEDAFQLWRFKHMYTVQRIIGNRRGTGGSTGVPFLKKALDTSFFPELFAIRTIL